MWTGHDLWSLVQAQSVSCKHALWSYDTIPTKREHADMLHRLCACFREAIASTHWGVTSLSQAQTLSSVLPSKGHCHVLMVFHGLCSRPDGISDYYFMACDHFL
jgi:hypothetical protein